MFDHLPKRLGQSQQLVEEVVASSEAHDIHHPHTLHGGARGADQERRDGDGDESEGAQVGRGGKGGEKEETKEEEKKLSPPNTHPLPGAVCRENKHTLTSQFHLNTQKLVLFQSVSSRGRQSPTLSRLSWLLFLLLPQIHLLLCQLIQGDKVVHVLHHTHHKTHQGIDYIGNFSTDPGSDDCISQGPAHCTDRCIDHDTGQGIDCCVTIALNRVVVRTDSCGNK